MMKTVSPQIPTINKISVIIIATGSVVGYLSVFTVRSNKIKSLVLRSASMIVEKSHVVVVVPLYIIEATITCVMNDTATNSEIEKITVHINFLEVY